MADESDTDTTLPADAPWWARWIRAEWRQTWKWLSVQLPIAGAIAIEAYQMYPDQVQKVLPPEWVPHIAAAAFILNALLVLRRKPAGAADAAQPAGATQQGAKP